MRTVLGGYELLPILVANSDIHVHVEEIEVVVRPDGSGNLTKAEVIVPGPNSSHTVELARNALVRAVLTLHISMRILAGPSHVQEEATEPDEKGGKLTGVTTLRAGGHIVAHHPVSPEQRLAAAPSSYDGVIYDFYSAVAKADPVDSFLAYFRVIEYYCDGSDLVHLQNGYGTRWRVPLQHEPTVVQLAHLTLPIDAALVSKSLKGLRDQASHHKKKKGYGVIHIDPTVSEAYRAWIPVIRAIAKDCLETNAPPP